MSDESRKRRTTDRGAKATDATATANPAREAGSNAIAPNPPRTTIWRWFTAPKFGSAGSGGAELEPGPERD